MHTPGAKVVRSSSPKAPPRAYPPGIKGVFAWMSARNPQLHSRVLAVMKSPQMAGLGITSDSAEVTVAAATPAPASPSVLDKLQQMLTSAGQLYLTNEQLKQQKKILDMQLQRAQAGLPPLDIDVTKYGLPGPQIGVGLNPQTQTLLIWGAVGLAAVYLLPKFLRR